LERGAVIRGVFLKPANIQPYPTMWTKTETTSAVDPERAGGAGVVNSVIVREPLMITLESAVNGSVVDCCPCTNESLT